MPGSLTSLRLDKKGAESNMLGWQRSFGQYVSSLRGMARLLDRCANAGSSSAQGLPDSRGLLYCSCYSTCSTFHTCTAILMTGKAPEPARTTKLHEAREVLSQPLSVLLWHQALHLSLRRRPKDAHDGIHLAPTRITSEEGLS